MEVRILDLDGSITQQPTVRDRAARIVPLTAWGRRLRLACGWRRFRLFQRELATKLEGETDADPWLTFVGSGDFHHVTLALLSRLTQPFNLLVLDNHPDWMRGVPFLHCGTWLNHALRLPMLRRVFHVGGDVDFDNYYRLLAPWSSLRRQSIVVMPAVRRFQSGSWARLPQAPLREAAAPLVDRSRLERLLEPWRDELQKHPLYVTLDRDVLQAEDAAVNWDSGRLRTSEVMAILSAFQRFGRSLAGMDVVGDWSPFVSRGRLRYLLHWMEHPCLSHDSEQARSKNESLNLRLIELVQRQATPTAELVRVI